MKKATFLLVILTILAFKGYSQSGFSYLGIRGGYTIEKGYTGTFFYNTPSGYSSSYELAAQYLTSDLKNQKDGYRNILGSLVYKSQMSRTGNTTLNFAFGASAGSDFDKFIVGPQLGFEIVKSIKGLDLLLSNRNEYIFITDKAHRLRFNFELGLRLPIN